MKPSPFIYHRPATLEDALGLLAEHGDDAKILAGGQSLVPLLALRLAAPAHLVDIGAIAALDTVDVLPATSEAPARLRIGATVTHRRAEQHPAVATHAPLLAEALPHIAHPQIRNVGTVCGSLAHADPAAELPAVALALDAELVIAGPGSERRVPASQFFRSYLETALQPDEVLVAMEVPAVAPGTGTAFSEVSRRSGDYAMVAVAALVDVDHAGTIVRARLALAGVATTPVRIPEAEEALVGRRVDATLAAHLADVAAGVGARIDPPADLHATAAYRRHLAQLLAGRALATAIERAREAIS